MRGRPLLATIVLLALMPAAVARAAGAQAGQKADDPEALFRSAFAQEVTPTDRVKLLERVVKEDADSAWADDALWVLGEAARRQGLSARVVYYWQFLISRWPAVHLEDYTRTLDVYRLSPVAGVQQLLEAEGTLYAPERGRVIAGKETGAFVYNNAVAFNSVPMLVWEGLGDSYAELGKHELAVAAFGKALAAAPAGGPMSDRFHERIAQKQDKEKARVASGAAAPPKTVTSARMPAGAPERSGAAHPPAASVPPAATAPPAPAAASSGTPRGD